MSTAEFVRICDLPGLEAGDLLWVDRAGKGETPLYILLSDRKSVRGWWVGTHSDRRQLETGSTGWPIDPDGRNAVLEVKVLRRLRGVSKAEVSNARWDGTLARLLAAPDFAPDPAPLKVGDTLTDPDAAPVGTFAEVSRHGGRSWGFLKTSEGWVTCSPENRMVSGEYAALDESLHTNSHSKLDRAVVVAFLPPEATTSRRAVVTALAALGHEGAKRRMAAETPVPLKVGDRVNSQAELDALPPGAVVVKWGMTWQRRIADINGWRPVGLPTPSRDWGDGLDTADCCLNYQEGAIKIVAFDVLADDRVSFARALVAQGYEPAVKALRDRPPMPKPGDKLTAADLEALPVGAVIDDGNTFIPWSIKTDMGCWHALGSYLKPKHDAVQFGGMQVTFSPSQTMTLVALDAPTNTAELRQWAAARGYARAMQYEAERAKKDVDVAPLTVQTQDMPTQQSQPQTITLMPLAHESDTAFQERVRKTCAAVASISPTFSAVPLGTLTAQDPAPSSLMSRLGASLKATGAGLASEALDRAKIKAARAGIDGAKHAVHAGLTELVELFAGERAAVGFARVVQMPATQVAEDYLISLGADLAGRPTLAAIARESAVERTVDGTFDLALGHIARAGARAIGALKAAEGAAMEAVDATMPAGQVAEAAEVQS